MPIDEREDWFECEDCDLVFSVAANTDAEIMAGKPFVCVCPRCGCAEITKR